MSKILVWDLQTRVFHWLMVFSFAGAYATGESEKLRDVHVWLGYLMLGLIAFRVIWGFVGNEYARFGSFSYGPGAVKDYLKSILAMRPQHFLGHNPAGSWAIWLLLALGLLTGVTGYALYQDVGGDPMEEFHEFAANFMLTVVAVSVAGVVLSSVMHKENLARAMVTGYKQDLPEKAEG